MSSSFSKSEAPPPTNPELLQHESALNIPPDPGNISQNPLINSSMTSGIDLILNSQSENQTQIDIVSFRQVLHYLWGNNNNNDASIPTPTPPQIWMTQNVYPLVTPMRIICYLISQLCFILAYGFYMKTEHYKTQIHAPLILFLAANIGNFLFLVLLMFFRLLTKVYERYLNHYLFKSVGEVMVMLVMSFVIMGIGHKHHQEGNYEVAGLVTCGFLTIYSLCIIILLKPGHHYSLLDATATLTLHLGLVGIYGIPASVFIFVILVIKNYIWSHNVGHNAQPCTHEDDLSRV